MKKSPKRIVVVLGMHRSGTSAIARGLQALGADLGDRLMPGVAGNNEKGFFEDVDANALNIEVLHALGRRWDTLTPLDAGELGRSAVQRLQLRAVELLRERLRGKSIYGLKDPRISMLMPFWKSAFAQVDVPVSYVICTRHPLSIARSLERRDGIELEKGLYLWLDHMVAAILGSHGNPRTVVSYDLLMRDPAAQLRRIADALGLSFDASSANFSEYAGDFLAEGLRHSAYESDDLQAAPNIPGEVVELHALLEKVARDEQSIDSVAVAKLLANVQQKLLGMRPALAYISRRDAQLFELEHALADRSGHARNLEQTIGELNARIHELQLVVVGRDGEIHGLNLTIAERDARLQAAQAQEGELRRVSDALAERSGHARNLEQTIGELNARIHELELVVVGRDGQIHGLNLMIAERDARVVTAERLSARTLELEGALAQQTELHSATIRRLQAGVAEEAMQVGQVAALARGMDFRGAGIPGPFGDIGKTLESCGAELLAVSEMLANVDLSACDEATLARCVDDARSVRKAAWERVGAAAGSLALSLVDSDRELEINRLRLLESLRDASRKRAEVARLGVDAAQLSARAQELEAMLALRDRELREKDRLLGQFGHQFVARLGAALDPYPGVRGVITAPLRFVHWILGRARA